MSSERQYYAYILANHQHRLYTGMTNDIRRRVYEHKQGIGSKFTTRYKLNQLVYYEAFNTSLEAIASEKRIKGWTRAKKIALIESMNPFWRDLYNDF